MGQRKLYSFNFEKESVATRWLEHQQNKTLSMRLAIEFIDRLYGDEDFTTIILDKFSQNQDAGALLKAGLGKSSSDGQTAPEAPKTRPEQTPATYQPPKAQPKPDQNPGIDISMLSTERDQ
ncbi:hypothetical protein [Limosilactobacillus mucosae]|jgi:hypothetical protein|uniref:hypothetical protein n=1 Tax=Limosilactobacillus mucosae TaxID=97478 RepID=UPI000EE47766|nr:hypothetical protein [Limosilactobacillus mucosae]HAM87139.1 hypothetical protein [Lactobacillus sp.]